MGVSLIPAMFLLRCACHVGAARKGVVLGRQKLHMPPRRVERFIAAAAGRGVALCEEDIVQPDGFTERLFAALGYPPIEALDFTDAEGAHHVHDLNRPVPDALRGRFDIVIDGGTSEHIFYIGQALDNCHEMLRPGGLFLSYVSCDGWFGHGFFQTGPDVPWRYWYHARGYEMIEVTLAPRKEPRQRIPVPDPTGRKRGGEMSLTGPHMLLYACRKPLEPREFTAPIQGHYA